MTDFQSTGHDRLEKLLAIASLGEQTRGRRMAEQTLVQVRNKLAAILELRQQVAALDDPDLVLSMVVHEALNITGAHGAAIALGTLDGMSCRATAGNPAPDVGVPVDVREGLSAQCVRNCEVIRCEDTEHDARVNVDVCRALGIRSIGIVPLTRGNEVAGLLEVFSAQPNAFDGDDMATLQLASALLSGELARIDKGAVRDAASNAALVTSRELVAPSLGVPQQQKIGQELNAGLTPDPQFSNLESLYKQNAIESWWRKPQLVAVIAVAFVIGLALWFIFRGDQVRVKATSVPSISQVKTKTPAATLDELRTAAEHGDAASQFAVGVKYASGNDFPHDDVQAAKWISMAADQGYAEAQTMLSLFYSAGRGVQKDLVKAYMWSAIASASGDQAGEGEVRFLKSIMTPDQIKLGDEQVSVWNRKRQEQVKQAKKQ